MPNWQPNWEDVRWNYDAANRAAGEFRRTADAIDQATRERTGAATEATREWRGPHRERFDSYVRDATGRGVGLANEYRDAAARIDGASEAARDEQARRVRERERWFREKADEERRAREDEDRRRHRRR